MRKTNKHKAHKKDYVRNPSKCACQCDKDYEIYQCLKVCVYIKSIDDDLVVTCEGIVDTQESAPVNPSGGTKHWPIAVVLSSIACLPLLVAIVVTYYKKSELMISCLLSYQYRNE